tara:strand:+ start:7804 stop:8736 length:933 start_codon:yes stop_codon:yes gene_type:complete
MDCKNCGSNVRNEDGFCSGCGARIIGERITLQFITKELLDKVLSIDNKLLKTFWHLFTKPELVIDGYINGVRKKYVEPFAYLLISITLAGISFYFLKDATIQALDTIQSTPNSEANPFGSKEASEKFLTLIFDYQSFIIILTIPIYALIAWIVFLNRKKYNFYEHVILFIYVSAQGSILNFLITTPVFIVNIEAGNIAAISVGIITYAYIAYILIRLFKLTFGQFIIKSLFFLTVSSFLFMLLMMLVVIVTFIYLGPGILDKLTPDKKNDSIQKIQPLDTILKIQKNDSIKKDKKTISFYEANSKLNCLS